MDNSLQADFVKRYTRRELTRKNVEYADKITVAVEGDTRTAYVMNMDDGYPFVHFTNYPYSYDKKIKHDDIIMEKDDVVPIKKKKLFRGIKNMGNTCFINSIVQSLIGISLFSS